MEFAIAGVVPYLDPTVLPRDSFPSSASALPA